MTRGVQTQLTEEQVRKWRAEADHALDVSDVLGERIVSQRVVALADAYLAQQSLLDDLQDSTDYEVIRLRRLVGAAENLNSWLENEGLWRAGDPDYNRTLIEFRSALAAVSVGSPETRETEE